MRRRNDPSPLLTRRRLLRDAGAGLATFSLLGCGGGSGGARRDAGAEGTDALAPTCGEITASNIEGPFFLPDSPARTDLTEPGIEGVRLLLEGQVLGTDCQPIAGALLDFWQADEEGDYDLQGPTLRGHQLADGEGRYHLETIIPGHYLNGPSYRPAHIHVKVGAAGFPLLTTQLYFEGDPFNDSDPFIVDSLIMPLADGPDGRREATFDFVLPPG